MLVVRPDPARGILRVRGRLDRVGADLLLGSLVALQRQGHRHIRIRMEPPATGPEAPALLAELAGRLAADGVHVTVE